MSCTCVQIHRMVRSDCHSASRMIQETLMKSLAKTILFGGFIFAAQAAMADGSPFPGASDDAGGRLTARVTYADQHANDRVANVVSAFPGASDEAGGRVIARVTYADQHANDRVAIAGSAFPGASDEAGVHLTARTTYAETRVASRS